MNPPAGTWMPIVVFLAALAVLGFGAQRVIIASAHTDPVSHIPAQDEALYSNCAIRMATSGDWITPKFLGRYLLYKPPLLMWLSGLSMKGLGVSLLALRLPVLVAGALVAALVFSMVFSILRPGASFGAAVTAAMLLVSNSLWHIYSRIHQTDALLVACIATAAYFWFRDPRLAGRAGLFGFGISTGAAIMTKSIGGVLPALMLLVFFALAPRDQQPSFERVVQVCLVAACVALPWHLYQVLVHPEWFWADYVKLQILGFGLDPPSQISQEGHLWFYLRRLILTDPVLCVFVVPAAPPLITALRRRDSAQPAILAAWIVTVGAAALLFRYRNLHYLLPVIPALCIIAAAYSPLLRGRGRQALVIGCLGLVFCVKAYFADQPWGLYATHVPPSAAALRAYCERGRANELILVSPDDDFYASVLPLRGLHYCFIDSFSHFEAYGPHFVYLGIVVTARQFAEMDRWQEQFRARLKAWGLDSSEPLATAIVAGSAAEVLSLIENHPQSDFFLPVEMREAAERAAKSTHQIVPGTKERFFLLALRAPGQDAARTELPRYW